MKTFKTILPALLLGALAIAACTKEKIVTVEKQVPVQTPPAATITITSPAEGDTYKKGDTVHIKATLIGQGELHGCNLGLVANEDSTIFFKHEHIHTSTITIDTVWINNLTTASADMMLNVDALIDHEGNALGKTVEFLAAQ
jgi:hypothetical protein